MTLPILPVSYNDGDTYTAGDVNQTNVAVNILSATQSLVAAKGDILAGTADDTLGRTAIGSNNTILTADSAQTNGVKWSSIFTGNVTGNLTGNVTGNADTATLATNVTTNANLTGGVTSVGNAATVVTNANLTGMVTSSGNATTVVTNANLTGPVTSVGNATAIQTNGASGSVVTYSSDVIAFSSGSQIHFVTSAPTSGGTVGDIWFVY